MKKMFMALAVALLVVAMPGVAMMLELHLPPAPGLAPARPLPADFIWGVSSSGIQSEGGPLDSNIHRLNATMVKDVGKPQDPYGSSVDFRHRYRQDIALAKGMGLNTYRIGISWPRIEPKRGEFDPVELAYYDDLMQALKQAGITPLITLNHFDYPGWVMDQGGWTNPQTVADFVSYARRIAQRYHPYTRWWLTFNEAAFAMAIDASSTKAGLGGAWTIRRHMIEAHRQSYDAIHQADANAMVSSNIVWTGDTFLSRVEQKLTDAMFLGRVEDKLDYVAVDYYMSDIADIAAGNDHWYIDPPGLYRALRELGRRYPRLPILIAETGMATNNGQPRADGVKREDALRDTVYWTQRARGDGIDVIGYMVWTLTDNFEWGYYWPRYGLYTVDVLTDPTLARKPTAAVPAYREITAGHGMASDYIPVLRSRR